MPIGKVGVVGRGAVSAMPEESTDERQTFSRHDRLTCGGMAQVVQAQAAELRIRADRAPARDEAGLPPRLGVARKQVRIRVARTGQRGDVRPRGLAERHGARASLRVAKVDVAHYFVGLTGSLTGEAAKSKPASSLPAGSLAKATVDRRVNWTPIGSLTC